MLQTLAQPLTRDAHAPSLPTHYELIHWSTQLTHAAITGGVAVGGGLALHWLVFVALRYFARAKDRPTESLAVARLNQSARWALVAMGLSVAADNDALVAHLWDPVERFVVPALVGWVIYSLVATFAELLNRHSDSLDDELAARSRRTRVALLSRVAAFIIIFVTVAMIMLGFPAVRHVGATLIASAGLLGLAVGAAAQPALKSLIAGIQIALTEPIRIGDFVVVEGENGRIEDIRLSYVVVQTNDERRLIVPTAKFLDSSFQNWTRVGGITGSVVLPVKPGSPIAPIRAAFKLMLADQGKWDERTGLLVVSEARVGSIELKLVVSAADPAALNRLRWGVREGMLEWLRENMPEALCTDT